MAVGWFAWGLACWTVPAGAYEPAAALAVLASAEADALPPIPPPPQRGATPAATPAPTPVSAPAPGPSSELPRAESSGQAVPTADSPADAPSPAGLPSAEAGTPALPTVAVDTAAIDVTPLEQGLASWYGPGLHRRRTASGELFDMHGFTAAHRTLPFGTQLCVRSLVNGRAVVVRINDRGPHLRDRVIDLSQAAARELGLMGLGIKPVAFWRMEEGDACEDQAPEALAPAPDTTAPAAPQVRRAAPPAQRRPAPVKR
ncbi:MAG: septal ring lytic transglycosylase RlpA family protein [Burkholderiaceae bacterium]